MVGRIAFRRFLRQCHRGLPWLLCIGGHRSATAQRTGRSVGLVIDYQMVLSLREPKIAFNFARAVPCLSVRVGLAALRFGAVNSTPSPFRAMLSIQPS